MTGYVSSISLKGTNSTNLTGFCYRFKSRSRTCCSSSRLMLNTANCHKELGSPLSIASKVRNLPARHLTPNLRVEKQRPDGYGLKVRHREPLWCFLGLECTVCPIWSENGYESASAWAYGTNYGSAHRVRFSNQDPMRTGGKDSDPGGEQASLPPYPVYTSQ